MSTIKIVESHLSVGGSLNKHATYIVERHNYGPHPIIDAMEVAVDTAAQVAKGYRLEAV